MKKNELNNGAVVITRSGEKYLKLDYNTLLSIRMDGAYISLKNFNDNLEHTAVNHLDIMKIYNRTSNGYGGSNYAVYSSYVDNEPTWERIEILDDKEREYLSQVIRPFRDRVDGIMKVEMFQENKQFICIYINNNQSTVKHMCFPSFIPGTMYKKMVVDKKYTLEELGL